jgi:hypothetical protein
MVFFGITVTLKGGKMKLFLNSMSDLSMHMIRFPPLRYQPRNVMVNYAFAFDPEFRNLFWSQGPTNLEQAFLVAKGVEEFLTAARRSQELLVVEDEQDDDDSCLCDQEPVVAELESYIELHEDEVEELNVQRVC